MKSKNVPRLRFPEFRDAPEWEESPLSKFFQSLDAGVSVNSGDRIANNGEFGILKTSAVTNGIFEHNENKVVLDLVEQQRLKESVQKNTIIISRMNTPALVGANAYIDNSFDNIFLPDRLWAAKPTSGASMRFIAYILGSEKGREALREMATGTSGSMKNITKSDVLGLKILAPLLSEQQKIADCLTSLDDLIAAQNAKAEALKKQKKALMQQLFPREGESVPHLRFPEFRDAPEWEEKKLGEICKFQAGFPFESRFFNTEGNGVRLIRNRDLRNDDNIIYYSEPYDDSFLVKNGDVLVGMDGDFTPSIWKQGNALLNQRVGRVSVKGSDSNLYFLYYFLYQQLKHLENITASTTVKHLSHKDIENINKPIPKIAEQQKIADCLSSLDDLINAQNKKIEELKAHKKGLMQQLFPSSDKVSS